MQCRRVYDWDAGDVLGLRSLQRGPPKNMLREIAKELDVSLEDMQRILDR